MSGIRVLSLTQLLCLFPEVRSEGSNNGIDEMIRGIAETKLTMSCYLLKKIDTWEFISLFHHTVLFLL